MNDNKDLISIFTMKLVVFISSNQAHVLKIVFLEPS